MPGYRPRPIKIFANEPPPLESTWIGAVFEPLAPELAGQVKLAPPRLGFWLGSDGGELAILACHTWFGDDNGEEDHGLITALKQALTAPLADRSSKPAILVVPDHDLAEILADSQAASEFEIGVAPVLGGLIESIEEHLEDFAISSQHNEMDMELIVPIEDDDAGGGVDEDTILRYHDAMLTYWRAKPWTTVDDSHIVKVTLPDGGTRIVTIMGFGGNEFGGIIYESERECREMADLGTSMDLGVAPDPNKVPSSTVFTFEDPEELPFAMEDYLDHYKPEWLEQSRWPCIQKYTKGKGATIPTKDDCETIIACAKAIATVARKKKPGRQWPLPKGQSETVSLGRGKYAPRAAVEIVGNSY